MSRFQGRNAHRLLRNYDTSRLRTITQKQRNKHVLYMYINTCTVQTYLMNWARRSARFLTAETAEAGAVEVTGEAGPDVVTGFLKPRLEWVVRSMFDAHSESEDKSGLNLHDNCEYECATRWNAIDNGGWGGGIKACCFIYTVKVCLDNSRMWRTNFSVNSTQSRAWLRPFARLSDSTESEWDERRSNQLISSKITTRKLQVLLRLYH